jgi:hypothetical protein
MGTMDVRGKVIYVPKATSKFLSSLCTMHDTDDLDPESGKCPQMYTSHWSSAIWSCLSGGAQWWEWRVVERGMVGFASSLELHQGCHAL